MTKISDLKHGPFLIPTLPTLTKFLFRVNVRITILREILELGAPFGGCIMHFACFNMFDGWMNRHWRDFAVVLFHVYK